MSADALPPPAGDAATDILAAELGRLADAVERARVGVADLHRHQADLWQRQYAAGGGADSPEAGDRCGYAAAVGRQVEAIEIHVSHMVQLAREAIGDAGDSFLAMLSVAWALRGIGREVGGAGVALVHARQAACAMADGYPSGVLAEVVARLDTLRATVVEVERYRVVAWIAAIDGAARLGDGR